MITLTNEMQEAVDLIANTNTPIYITGKAGTGKTTFLKHIVKSIEKKFVITAPTGIAAINAGGVTLHSLFGIPFGVLDPDDEINSGFRAEKAKLMDVLDVLIIDEISMVRPDILDYIDMKLRVHRGSDEPFGGVQLVMFGDLFQLPPVVIGEDKKALSQYYDGVYFFYARVFRECGFKVVELNHIFRQTEPRFIEILNNLRTYKITADDIEDLAGLRDKKISGQFENSYIHICSYKRDVQHINTELLGTPTMSWVAEIVGDFKLSSAPCDDTLQLREGARIMMLVNNREKGYCNGSLGTVEIIRPDSIQVLLDSGRSVSVEKYEWQNVQYEVIEGKITPVVKGTCRQFPMTLAWAITIHKSQGLTFDRVAIHTSGVFCPGQIYVALSRCTTLDGIVSDSFINRKHILPDWSLLAFETAYHSNGHIFNINNLKMAQHERTVGRR